MAIKLTTPRGYKNMSLRYVNVDGRRIGVIGNAIDFFRIGWLEPDYEQNKPSPRDWLLYVFDEMAARFGQTLYALSLTAESKESLVAMLNAVYGVAEDMRRTA